MNLLKQSKFTRVMDAVAAGTTNQNSGSVDMKGYESVLFVASFGTIVAGAATSVKLQTSSDNSSFNDVLGTSITVADSDDTSMAVLDLSHPLERYIRMVVLRATQNATIDGVTAMQYEANVEPTTHDSTTVLGSEFHHAAIEGTA